MSILQKLNPTYVTEHALKTFARFPLVILCAIVSGVMVNQQILLKSKENLWILESMIGMCLFLSLYLHFERHRNTRYLYGSILAILGFLIGLHYANPFDYESSLMRLFQVLVAAHVLVAIAPFLSSHERNGFWHFNERLFLRFCLSSIYTGVLFLGTLAIMYSLKGLFDMPVSDDALRYVWLICFFGFHPVHFLAGVPSDFSELEQSADYPNMLRIFCKYLLCSLVVVYGVILLSYGVKICLQREWPKGLVCSLIGCYSIAGIYTYLMLHPLVEGERWARTFGRAFLSSLLPLSVLMLAAIYRRYWEYGLTESRYIIILYALWLCGISSYLLFSKSKNIRLVPLSLFFACIGTAFGPWGAYSLSLRYQQNKLEKMLKEQKILVEEKIKKTESSVEDKTQMEITSVVKYILERHGTSSMKKYFDGEKVEVKTEQFMTQLGLKAIFNWQNRPKTKYCTLSGKELKISKSDSKLLPIQSRYSDSFVSSGWYVSIVEKEVIIKFKDDVLYSAKASKFLEDLGYNQELCHQDVGELHFQLNGRPVRLGISRMQANISDVSKETYVSELAGVLIY